MGILDAPIKPAITFNNYYKNFSSDPFPHYRTACSYVKKGFRDAKVLIISDSTGWGVNANPRETANWPGLITSRLNSLIPTSLGMNNPWWPSSNVDNNWTLGTGWVDQGGKGFATNSAITGNGSTPSGNLVWSDNNINADTYDVYYYGTAATITCTATGGTPVVRNTSTSLNGYNFVTISSASASTTNTVTISATGGSPTIVGIEGYLNNTKKIRIANCSTSVSASNDWANFTDTSTALQSVYAPDITFIGLGKNDAGASVSVATYIANITRIILAARLSGDVCLFSEVKTNTVGDSYQTYEPQYAAALQNSFSDVPYINMYQASVDQRWISFSYMGDALHPNNRGYIACADILMPAFNFYGLS